MIFLAACATTLGVVPDPGDAAVLPTADVTITACDDEPTPDVSPDSTEAFWFAPGVSSDRPTLAYFWVAEDAGTTEGTVANGRWSPATQLRWQEDGVIVVSIFDVSGCYVYQW